MNSYYLRLYYLIFNMFYCNSYFYSVCWSKNFEVKVKLILPSTAMVLYFIFVIQSHYFFESSLLSVISNRRLHLMHILRIFNPGIDLRCSCSLIAWKKNRIIIKACVRLTFCLLLSKFFITGLWLNIYALNKASLHVKFMNQFLRKHDLLRRRIWQGL